MTTQDASNTVERRFSSIVVPVDGSDVSEHALEYAMQLNAERVVLLRVEVDEPPADRPDPTDPYEQWRRDHLSTVTHDLERLARQNVDSDTVIEPKIRFGSPADQIMAEGHDHDLIVMGATGKGAAGRLLFGSVADRVTRYSVTPTLLVRGRDHGVAVTRPARIVVPLDGSDLAESALPVAKRASEVLGVPIRLVRCVGMDEVLYTIREARRAGDSSIFDASDDPYALGRERAEAEAMEYLESVRDRIGGDGANVTCDRQSGTPGFEVVWDLNEDDLVVMTSRGRSGIRRWMLGSVSEKLVREAKAPVLLVPVGRSVNAG